jgi:hypothetical protein
MKRKSSLHHVQWEHPILSQKLFIASSLNEVAASIKAFRNGEFLKQARLACVPKHTKNFQNKNKILQCMKDYPSS